MNPCHHIFVPPSSISGRWGNPKSVGTGGYTAYICSRLCGSPVLSRDAACSRYGGITQKLQDETRLEEMECDFDRFRHTIAVTLLMHTIYVPSANV